MWKRILALALKELRTLLRDPRSRFVIIGPPLIQLLIFGYLKGAFKSGKTQFVQEAIEIIVSGLGEEYDELFRPFGIALEYMQTKDVSMLERLQQEERELVLEIAGQAKE